MTVLQTMWDKAAIVRMRARGVFALGAVMASLLFVALPGFLWVTTAQGLMRFDGVRFMPWQPPRGQNLGMEPRYGSSDLVGNETYRILELKPQEMP